MSISFYILPSPFLVFPLLFLLGRRNVCQILTLFFLSFQSFLIYNEGFTIERFIHGMEAEYNDVVRWKYTEIPEVFGAKDVRKFVIKTRDELEKLLSDKEFNDSDGLQFVEMWMPKDDAPRALKLTAKESAKTNAQLE